MTPRGAIVPIARCPIEIRPATAGDLPFIDALQKAHSKQVGFMHIKALEGKIAANQVLLATDDSQPATPLGYCIGQDQYFKHDDIGIIYQLNVVPAKQRGLIGATLVKAMFDRAAYGCRLFCCWCAQDIEANYFWESLGFLPLAFRAGSRGKGRVHIFWQRRIREGDTTTPYWFPAQTSSGAIREDRLVLPIPPAKHWRDVMPVVLPKEKKMLAEESGNKSGVPKPKAPKRRFVQFGPPPRTPVAPPQAATVVLAGMPVPKKKQKLKNDPKHVAAARELRDRYMEQFNTNAAALTSSGKYDVSRQLADDRAGVAPVALLPAA
jgi:hypothetical protein